MGDREEILKRAVKIYKLAKRGVGGGRSVAKNKFNDLCKKHHISFDELNIYCKNNRIKIDFPIAKMEENYNKARRDVEKEMYKRMFEQYEKDSANFNKRYHKNNEQRKDPPKPEVYNNEEEVLDATIYVIVIMVCIMIVGIAAYLYTP